MDFSFVRRPVGCSGIGSLGGAPGATGLAPAAFALPAWRFGVAPSRERACAASECRGRAGSRAIDHRKIKAGTGSSKRFAAQSGVGSAGRERPMGRRKCSRKYCRKLPTAARLQHFGGARRHQSVATTWNGTNRRAPDRHGGGNFAFEDRGGRPRGITRQAGRARQL